jgi:hypothetical protein
MEAGPGVVQGLYLPTHCTRATSRAAASTVAASGAQRRRPVIQADGDLQYLRISLLSETRRRRLRKTGEAFRDSPPCCCAALMRASAANKCFRASLFDR